MSTIPDHADNTAQTWRDVADQLTLDQVERFTYLESLISAGAPDEDSRKTGLLQQARWEAEQNLTDQHIFGEVPLPDGARSVDHWENNGCGEWTRRLSLSTRSIDSDAVTAKVFVEGVQSSDGSVQWSLSALADDQKTLTAQQARDYAAMLVAAADELDMLTK